ncbi:MAG TPA: hypothetical protein VL181_01285, partial [Holophagaceae bacterium]|nr:hypothetical protein [Holophagaceae bacterium]
NFDSLERSEYVASVDWIAEVARKDAKWRPKSGLFTTQHVRASLDNQPTTVTFLNKEFGVDLKALAK